MDEEIQGTHEMDSSPDDPGSSKNHWNNSSSGGNTINTRLEMEAEVEDSGRFTGSPGEAAEESSVPSSPVSRLSCSLNTENKRLNRLSAFGNTSSQDGSLKPILESFNFLYREKLRVLDDVGAKGDAETKYQIVRIKIRKNVTLFLLMYEV